MNESEINMKTEITVANLFKFLWLKKKFISVVVAISLVVVTLYSFIAPFQFTSEASILPPEDAGGFGDLTSFLQTLSGGVSLGAGGRPSKLLIYQEILGSQELAIRIVKDLNLVKRLNVDTKDIDNLYSAVLAMMDVELKRTGIIALTSYTGTGYFPTDSDKENAANLSADILNSAIKVLDEINREKSTSKSKRQRVYIEKVLATKNHDLDSMDNVIETFRKENKLFSLDDQSTAIINNAVTIGGELAKAELDLNLKKLEYAPSSPIIKTADEKFRSLNKQYQKIQSGGIVSDDQFSIPLKEVPALMKTYTNLIRDQKVIEQVKLYLETQRYQEAIQEESDVPTVEVLDSAKVPKTRISPNRKIMLILGFFISLTGACLYLIVRGVMKQDLVYQKENNLPVSQ